ncbi:HAD-IA family hydrolase [Desulfobacterales bacterium HSG2]|nr:HAD-IA family hydrolase [Desulfobacterales bacterium HSG2]
MIIAERLYLPEDTEAILWDMDGVLLDTLGLDLTICNQLLRQYFGEHVTLSKAFIRSIFAYHPPEFWRRIFEFVNNEYDISGTESDFDQILETYNQARNEFVFEVNPGIREILESAGKIPLRLAVVSNNPTEDIKKILSQSGIPDYFDLVIGNDVRDLKKKPAPDTYLLATEMLGVKPERCAVIEDSLVGAEAGHRAGCLTIGVATGGDDFEPLEESQWTDQVCSSFHPNRLHLQFGKVTNKTIFTPNEFVSHTIEHIAWRMGCEIDLYWNNNDWHLLGKTIGTRIKKFEHQQDAGVALGMIDDGSAEVVIERSDEPDLVIDSVKNVDLDWFLSLRCEQVCSGEPLTKLIQGLSQGLGAKMYIRVCSLEDPHHTYEGIFRSIGIALNQIYTPKAISQDLSQCKLEKNVSQGDISVNARSCEFAEVARKTAESSVSVVADFSRQVPGKYHFQVSPAVNVSGLPTLLDMFAREAGFTLQVDFDATVLSSSHVLLEDTGLVLGRALKEILVLRMEEYGVNAAGSSLATVDDFRNQPIRTGISVEGRKFGKIVPFKGSFDDVRQRFIIGQNVCNGLFSEDLDDFLDGLSGGLGCSIMIHIKEQMEPDEGWQMIFKNMGKALKGVFALNPYRKGVPPGVKATLS